MDAIATLIAVHGNMRHMPLLYPPVSMRQLLEFCESHLTGIISTIEALVRLHSSKRALLGAQSAREDLESGITTVRNLGHSGVDGDTELRDAINAGRVPGPVSGRGEGQAIRDRRRPHPSPRRPLGS